MTTTGVSRAMGHNDNLPVHLAPSPIRSPEDTRAVRTTMSRFDDSSDDDEEELEDEEEFPAPTPTTATHSNIPLHPIPSMQDAFAESLEEATKGLLPQKPKLRTEDAKTRRERLLDEDKSEGPPNRLWRFRPGQKCHELRKLMAQISFGVYLLLNGLANSNAQVLFILQGHIDEVDEFLEMTMEDVKMAISDLEERLDFLKLPMENVQVFEQMLQDRKVRLQIVEGNVKIEHILSRTSTAHTQTIRDISEGLRSTKQFASYLSDNEKGRWRQDRPDILEVFEAMKGNTDGWRNAFATLETNSTLLSGFLVRLSAAVVEIDKKAGEVSRRTRFTMEPYSAPEGRPVPRSPESTRQATPPPSPPTSKPDAPPRIRTLYFGASMTSLLEAPESPVYLDIPARSDKRATKDSDTTRDTMLAFQYTPPDSGATIPDVVIEQGSQANDEEDVEEEEEEEAKSESNAGPGRRDSAGSAKDVDDNALFILQPRTYTPIPPAPIPSPRISAEPRPPISGDSTPDELSIHIEAEEIEDGRQSESLLRESVIIFPEPPSSRPRPSPDAHPTPLQLNQRRPSDSQEGETKVEPKASTLRQRVSLKIELPHAIHVPPANALELQRPRYPTPQASPRGGHRPLGPALGPNVDRPKTTEATRRYNTATGYSPPVFPQFLASPASEHQYFRPVQASPHSPLQQRPHTAGTTVDRQGGPRHASHQRNVPSAMGMSLLSNVTAATQNSTTTTGTSRTVKKKRSAFGWLKKAFSLDEEERIAFEARKRQQPVNYYDGRSPRYLDGRRIG